MEFIGYHGTNEVSACSILAEGVQERYLPSRGQIGRGFYVARLNGKLPRWAAETSTLSARNRLSYFTRMVSALTGDASNPFFPNAARQAVLKIYTTKPLKGCKWSIMNCSDLHSLKITNYDNDGAGLHVSDDASWLQMVVPVEEIQYLRARRDDGHHEQPQYWFRHEA